MLLLATRCEKAAEQVSALVAEHVRCHVEGVVEPIVGMYKTILPASDTLEKSLLFFNFPFTLAKGIVVAAITMFIYKPLSNLIVRMNNALGSRKKG